MTSWPNRIFGDMKTAEELEQMREPELIEYCLELQEKVKTTEENAQLWSEQYVKASNKYDALRTALKSISSLTE